MRTKKKASVVILNWNGKILLARFLEQVVRYTLDDSHDVEVIVADNGSEDGSLDFIRTNFSGTVQCIDLKHNHGFAEGYNQALAGVEAEYVVLLNSDVEVTPGWLKTLTDYLDEHPDVSACQPKILSYRDRTHFEHAGAAGGFIDQFGFPFCRGRILADVEEDKGQYDQIADIFWATGACLCIRLDAYRDAGGLDARFFAHMEEIDLCWRLKSRGQRIVCLPESRVYHIGGATLEKSNPGKTYLNYRNNLLMLYKNLPVYRLTCVLLVRTLMDYLSAFIFLCSGKTGDVTAVFRARRDYHKMRPMFRAQRLENLSAATVRHIPELYAGSIVMDRYLRGIRRYSALFKKSCQ